MNKKRIAIILGIVVIIIIIILLSIRLISIRNNDENTLAFNDENNAIENQAENNVVIDNETNNEVENNIQEENEDNTQDENVEEPNPPADDKQEVSKEIIEKEQSNEEKAMDIVKKDWGEDSKVYFSYEGITEGKYKVCVRETETTHAITYYLVNVNNGTFEIQN